jgi:hypothetical protein
MNEEYSQVLLAASLDPNYSPLHRRRRPKRLKLLIIKSCPLVSDLHEPLAS